MKKFKILLIVGLASLLFGGFTLITNKDQNENNLEIAMNSNDAFEAARQISQNNKKEVNKHILSMFLLGFGGALTVVSLFGMKAEKKNNN